MAYIAEQVEVDDSHNEVYVIGNKCFTLISQELNGTVVNLDESFYALGQFKIGTTHLGMLSVLQGVDNTKEVQLEQRSF